MDYLLIELVNHYRDRAEGPSLQARRRRRPPPPPAAAARRRAPLRSQPLIILRISLSLAQAALDAIGFSTGRRLAERLTAGRAPLAEPLDVVKWACKELWSALFRRPVDNLKTNHRGTFQLRDTRFPWAARIAQNLVAARAAGAPRLSGNELAAEHLVLPAALLRGALAALGLDATVTADATALPQVDFTVVTRPPQPPLR